MSQDLTVLIEPEVAALSDVLAMLGDPMRLRIVLLLCDGERSVSQIVARLGRPQPTVSRHLGLLHRVGLVTARRAGKSIFYALDGRLTVHGDGCELRIGTRAGLTIHLSKDVAGRA